MNSENFSSYLKDPSKLYQIPYQELKTLVVQYPYCQPLRVLLLQKSQMERHPDFERNLHAAATYLPDRTVLYFLVREFQALETGDLLFELEEERLELKALSEVFAASEPEEPPVLQQQADVEAVMGLFEAEGIEEGIEEEIEEEDMEIRLKEKARERVVAPMPKSVFSSWQKRYDHLRLAASIHALDIPAPPPVKRPAPGDAVAERNPDLAHELAKRSLEEKEGLVSETLAELLARQGHIQKAISMYEKLGLIFPEKSHFFAQKIEKLKRK